MRLDYTMYTLSVLLLIISILPFIVQIEGVDDNAKVIWVTTSAVLGLLSFGLGYSQKPKTQAQACENEAIACKNQKESTLKETTELVTENKIGSKTPETIKSVEFTTNKTDIELLQVRGIGEKRVKQLKEIGINTANDLVKESPEKIAKKLKISPKITRKWNDSAKKLLK